MSGSNIMVSQLWDVFNTDSGMEKVAALTEDYLRDRIRETSVLNRAIPPVLLTEAQIERNTANDWPLKRVEIEPDSKAFIIGFRGKGSARFMEGRKYEVYFTKIETEHFKKTREELMTMRYPVMDVVNNNFVLDMQEQLDFMFKTRLDAAAALSGISGTADFSTNANIAANFKDSIIDIAQKIIGKRRRPARLIMSEATFLNLGRLTPDKLGYGDAVQRIAFNGVYPEKQFFGYEVLTSINAGTTGGTTNAGSVWPHNKIYIITEPGFLGSNFILGDVNQEMKREGNILEWWDWADQGCELGNVSSVGVVTLTGVTA